MQNTYLVPSSTAGKSYTVSLDRDGRPTCTCPDYQHRRAARGEFCKHGREIVARVDAAQRADAVLTARQRAEAIADELYGTAAQRDPFPIGFGRRGSEVS